MSNKENTEPLGRTTSIEVIRDKVKRLRIKADGLEKLANELDGKLSPDAEIMLWFLVSNQR